MPPTSLATFDRLCRRLSGTALDPTKSASEAARLVKYLRDLGFTIVTANDVLNAIDADPSEEELSAHRCVEGVVSHASDGWWLLLPHGNVSAAARELSHPPSVAIGDQTC